MKTCLKVLVVVGIVISLCGVIGCAKKRLSVGSEETTGSQIGAREGRGEEGYDSKAREARLRDLEPSKGRVGIGEPLTSDARAFEEEMIFFEFDRYDLTPEAKVVLERKAKWLKANPGYRIRIEGHCDERGTNEYNLALGDRRANAAKSYLIYLGIEPERISTISYGEERPLDPRHTEEAYSKNRRAEFKLIK